MEINISGIFFPAQDIFCKIEYKKGYSCFCSPGEKKYTQRKKRLSCAKPSEKIFFQENVFSQDEKKENCM